MIWLLLGLAAFLLPHSLRVFAPGLREARIRDHGALRWKMAYSIVAIAGFALLVWGFSMARAQPVLVWAPPTAMRHVAALLTLPAFILLVAAYVPRNHFKARLGHPMLLAVKLWALAHLLASGWLHSMLLAGAFLVWAVVLFRDARRRPGPAPAPGSVPGTLACVMLGGVAWVVFAMWAHVWLIGRAPFG